MTDKNTPKETLGGKRLDAVVDLFPTNQDSIPIPPFRSSLRADAGSEEIPSTRASGPVYVVVCPDGLIPNGAVLGCLLAQGMSKADVAVGLVETTVKLPHTFFLSGGYHNLNAVFWENDPRLPEFLNIVARFRNTGDLLLLSMTSSRFLDSPGLMALTERCLVPASVNPEELLKVYAAVKRIANEWNGAKIDFVVFEDRMIDKAPGAAVVLERMAGLFLPGAVRFIGGIPMAPNTAAPCGVLSEDFLRDLPEAVTIAAGEIAGNLMKSTVFR